MSGLPSARFAWPLLTVILLATCILITVSGGLGWWALALVPSGVAGFLYSRSFGKRQAVADARRDSARGVAVVVAIALGLLLPRLLAPIGMFGPLMMAMAASASTGYMLYLSTQRDVLKEVDRRRNL